MIQKICSLKFYLVNIVHETSLIKILQEEEVGLLNEIINKALGALILGFPVCCVISKLSVMNDRSSTVHALILQMAVY